MCSLGVLLITNTMRKFCNDYAFLFNIFKGNHKIRVTFDLSLPFQTRNGLSHCLININLDNFIKKLPLRFQGFSQYLLKQRRKTNYKNTSSCFRRWRNYGKTVTRTRTGNVGDRADQRAFIFML